MGGQRKRRGGDRRLRDRGYHQREGLCNEHGNCKYNGRRITSELVNRVRRKVLGRRRRTPEGGSHITCPSRGGACPPKKRVQACPTSPWNVCTCCCREATETSRITTTGCTWMGEFWKTLFGSIVGADWMHNSPYGMSQPLVQ